MNKIIIFYEDTKESCRKFAQEFAAHENIQCRKASDYAKEPIIFASNARIGLIFESSSGKIPGDIAHIIQKLVADKTKDHMILVTGGGQELRTVRAAAIQAFLILSQVNKSADHPCYSNHKHRIYLPLSQCKKRTGKY